MKNNSLGYHKYKFHQLSQIEISSAHTNVTTKQHSRNEIKATMADILAFKHRTKLQKHDIQIQNYL